MIYRCSYLLPSVAGLLLLLAAAPASGEPQVGRMSDGTPYRTDAEGNQLADHIAELEVTILDLRKQVGALEDELDKNQVAHLKTSRAEEAKSASRSLTDQRTTSDTEELERLRNSEAACLRIKTQLEQDVTKLRSANASGLGSNTSCDAQTATLRSQITQLQTALMDGPSKERIAGAAEERHRLEVGIAEANTSLSERESALRDIKAQLADAQSEISHLQGNLAARESREKELLQQVAQLQSGASARSVPVADVQPVYSRTSVARASLGESEADARSTDDALEPAAIKESKKEFRAALSGIQSLILNRKALLDAAKKNRREVSVKVQPLISKRGDSLDSLRILVDKFSTKQESETISQGLAEIKGILDQDVAVLKRLS